MLINKKIFPLENVKTFSQLWHWGIEWEDKGKRKNYLPNQSQTLTSQ